MASEFVMELNRNQNRVKDNLEEWKNVFRNEIGSVRKMDRIKTLYDLIDCLERCDILIKYTDNNFNNHMKSSKYYYLGIDNDVVNENVYAAIRRKDTYKPAISMINKEFINKSNSNSNNKNNSMENFIQYKHKIYKLIAREIGSFWRSFGRELNLSQGVMDDIQIRYPYDLKSQVHKMLEIFEENESHNVKEHATMICRALDECRRKDLRRKIESILTSST